MSTLDDAASAENEIARVQRTLQDLIRSDNDGDASKAASCYLDDAIWIPPAGPIVKGRSKIRESYARVFDEARFRLTLRSEETWLAGDLAYDRGITTGSALPADGGAERAIGDHYIAILRRDDHGEWRVARLMWRPLDEPLP